jgi:hypothetical protein
MSVSLASPDGRVVGGGVAGLLVAASPVQVLLFYFHKNLNDYEFVLSIKLKSNDSLRTSSYNCNILVKIDKVYYSVYTLGNHFTIVCD